MAKFLKVTTVNNGKHVIPADGVIFCKKSNGSNTIIYYEADNVFDQITVEHGNLTGHEFADFLQNQFINLAQTNWRNAVVDITSSAPSTVQSVTMQ